LVNVDRLDVAAMVLVEVCEAVVEENGRLDGFGDGEAQDADVCFLLDARGEGVGFSAPAPLGAGVRVGFEGC
jgi:hypothetical protein